MLNCMCSHKGYILIYLFNIKLVWLIYHLITGELDGTINSNTISKEYSIE
jgi:hypothetical protein